MEQRVPVEVQHVFRAVCGPCSVHAGLHRHRTRRHRTRRAAARRGDSSWHQENEVVSVGFRCTRVHGRVSRMYRAPPQSWAKQKSHRAVPTADGELFEGNSRRQIKERTRSCSTGRRAYSCIGGGRCEDTSGEVEQRSEIPGGAS